MLKTNKIRKVLVKKLVVLFIFFTLQTPANANNPWSLQKCIQFAIENNIQLKQQQLNIKSSENALLQSKLGLLPNLNANASQNFNYGRSIDYISNAAIRNNTQSLNMGVYSSTPLFTGFQNINTIKRNNFNLLENVELYNKVQNDISLNITSAYLQILFNAELLQVQYNQLSTTIAQLQRVQQLVDAGSEAKGKLLEIQAQAANEELQIVKLQNDSIMSVLTLVQMLNLDTAHNFSIDTLNISQFNPEIVVSDVKMVFDIASENMPQVKSAKYRLESSKTNVTIAKGARLPSLMFNAGVNSNYTKIFMGNTTIGDGFGSQLNNNQSKYIGFSLNIPIFNAWQTNTNISNANITLINAQYNLSLTQKELYKQIQQAYSNVMAAYNSYKATQKALMFMLQSFNYAQQKFDVGQINTYEYYNAKNQLAKARSNLIQSKYDLILKTQLFNFFKGAPIQL